jgi:NTP pyrophosphatase (non-canonical NTP hydrolase)
VELKAGGINVIGDKEEFLARCAEESRMRDMTDLEIYQDFVDEMRTFKGTYREELIWASIGLASEAGEVAGEVEKMMRKGEAPEEREEKIFDEVSDVLFYCVAVLSALGRNPDECITHNIAKLRARHG